VRAGSPRRVAIIGSRGYPSTYSGYETLVRHLAPWLADHGMLVTVYCRDECPDEVDVPPGITCVRTRGLNGKSTSTLSYGASSVVHACRAGYDAALVLNCANGLYLPLLRRAGVPTAVNVDGVEWKRDKWNALGKATFRTAAQFTARYADEIVVDSRAIGALWADEFGRRSTYIPYGGVVGDVGDDRVAALGINRSEYILAVARIVPENNISLFLDAWRAMDPQPVAVLVGSANYRSDLEREVADLARTSSRFRWLGHVSDQELLTALWSNCGAYFHGHSVGGTNPSLLQAMGLGAPVVAVDTAFNREVIRHPEQLVAADPVATAQALDALLADEQRRRDWGGRAQQIVETQYRWDDVCRQYEACLADLADRSESRFAPVGVGVR
jgi:glycosyltransferase involved in cell wall biosynthesis